MNRGSIPTIPLEIPPSLVKGILKKPSPSNPLAPPRTPVDPLAPPSPTLSGILGDCLNFMEEELAACEMFQVEFVDVASPDRYSRNGTFRLNSMACTFSFAYTFMGFALF